MNKILREYYNNSFKKIKMIQNDESLNKKIIKWWNDNAFLGYIITDVKNIKSCFKIFNRDCQKHNPYNFGYKNIQDMIEYHNQETEMNIDYEKEIKNKYKLKSSKFLDFYLDLNLFKYEEIK